MFPRCLLIDLPSGLGDILGARATSAHQIHGPGWRDFTRIALDPRGRLPAGVATCELVRYSIEVAGQTLSETVPYEPGPQGQFIYTGGRPDSVIIRGIAAGSEGVLPG